MPFQRTGKFPLDRTDLFNSYEDAVKYAAGDVTNPDERGLCGTSYIGQILTVYENDIISVYMINANRTLQAISSASASVDNISVELNESQQICIKGFNNASDGYMLIKDPETHQLKWVEPISREGIDAAIAEAKGFANLSKSYSEDASVSVQAAERIKQDLIDRIWFGTLGEYYNLETVYDDHIYIITDGFFHPMTVSETVISPKVGSPVILHLENAISTVSMSISPMIEGMSFVKIDNDNYQVKTIRDDYTEAILLISDGTTQCKVTIKP